MLGTVWAFAYRHRETEKNLCRGGRSQDLPSKQRQHVKETNFHTPDGIRTSNSSKRTAVYLRLWPRGKLYRVTHVLLLTSAYIYAFYLQQIRLVFLWPFPLLSCTIPYAVSTSKTFHRHYQLICGFHQILTEFAWKVPITSLATPDTYAQLLFSRSVFSATKTKFEKNFTGQNTNGKSRCLPLDVRFGIEFENQSKF